jgi:hypothetical protein
MTGFLGVGIFWVAVSAFFLLVLVSRIAWSSRRPDKQSYFPSHDLCEGAHDRFHLSTQEKEELKKDGDGLKEPDDFKKAIEAAEGRFWHTMAFRLISRVPEELTIDGFFATVAWPFIVLMNVLLLAQILGVLVGTGGGEWDVFRFGTYAAVPLLMAVLYAFSQTVCGIIYGESHGKKRYLFLAFLVAAILAEGALAVYRAWLIRGGVDAPGANLIDNSLGGRFGVVIGAFFGIIFPVTHAALGYVGYPKFVVPVVRYSLRVMGGIALLALSVANYFLLAWHSVHPKDNPKRIEDYFTKHPEQAPPNIVVISPEEMDHRNQQKILLAEAAKLFGYLGILLDDLPAIPAAVKKSVDEARILLGRWNQVGVDANEQLAASSTLAGSGATGIGRLRDLYKLAGTHNKLNELIKCFRKDEIELEQEANDEGKRLLAALASNRADLVKLKARLDEIGANAAHGRTAVGLLGACDVWLGILNEQFRKIPAPVAGDFRFTDYQELAVLVRKCQAAYSQLVGRWATSKPIIPTAQELEERRRELEAVPDLTKAYSDARTRLYEALRIANERLKKVEERPWWFYWLADRIA